MLFCAFIESWKKSCRIKVSEGWKKSQDQMIRDYIAPDLGTLRVSDITPFHISSIITGMNQLGRSCITIKHVYNVLNGMFQSARDDFEIIDRSPVKPKLHRPTVIVAERKFLYPKDAEKLLRSVASSELYGAAVWIQTLCGLRVGEVQGLKWEDVDFKSCSIVIRRSWCAKTKRFQNHTKNKTQFRVPMPKPLTKYLKKIKPKHSRPGDFVCQNESGEHLSRNSYMHALPRLCADAGVQVVSSHELRHTCAELWISCGASAEDIRRLFNHKSLTSTKTYIHRTDFRLQSISKKVMTRLLAA